MILKYRVSNFLLVAQKGIRGFRNTNILGEFTTIIGTGKLPVYNNLTSVIKSLIPVNGVITPCVFKLDSLPKTTNDIRICDFSEYSNSHRNLEKSVVFKYAIDIKKTVKNNLELTNCILVDNSNRRFIFEISACGTIQKLYLIKTQVQPVSVPTTVNVTKQVINDNHLKVVSSVDKVERNKSKIISFYKKIPAEEATKRFAKVVSM
jgi:hypothetical protein